MSVYIGSPSISTYKKDMTCPLKTQKLERNIKKSMHGNEEQTQRKTKDTETLVIAGIVKNIKAMKIIGIRKIGAEFSCGIHSLIMIMKRYLESKTINAPFAKLSNIEKKLAVDYMLIIAMRQVKFVAYFVPIAILDL